ncbi:MAG: FAD-binding oxidoreductase [Clostridiales bacterium]|nr:FAD-binding oxidoreductase [Clostridiales bacterium]
MYRKIDHHILKKLGEIAGQENVISDQEKITDYSHDESSSRDIAHPPEVVVKPGRAEEVAAVLELASHERIPVTPRGGATGLCGGCVPVYGGIVLSLERMNRIIELDRDNQMAVVEPGVTLGEFNRAVEEAGLSFPPHPGDESAQIGGLIATNAGGSRAVKYGVIRNYVRGLEVVLPQGEIIRLGGKLMKTSTGYSLLQLLIGSEGTLGVITRAVIQLLPALPVTRSLVIPFADIGAAIETVPLLLGRKITPLAVEFIEAEVIRITEEFLRKRWPSRAGETYLLVILDASSEEEMDLLSEAVAEVCLGKGGIDVFIADTPKKQDEVLEIRSKIYEAIKSQTVEILDICIPRAEIAGHVRRVREISKKRAIWLPTFGHAADGNVHTHIMKARCAEGKMIPVPDEEWRAKVDLVRDELYADCRARGGVISGEHGIGLVKKPFLSLVLDDVQIRLMKEIKKLFDPHLILNPGKIFDS